jgi:two-component system alkaline phosphatase synthesis response regulator PhoP
MATATWGVTWNTPMSETQLAPRERILVIEADGPLQKSLRQLFFSEGYEVEVVPDGIGSLEMIRLRAPAAVILHLQHPGPSGYALCKSITQLIPGLPLLILSARSDVADKVLLLEQGADDYVTIPFNPIELAARLRALIRRASRVSAENVYVFEDVTLDFSKAEISRGGERIAVTTKEFETLKFLVQNSRRVISRDELLREVWGYRNGASTRTVDTHILRLRRKLECAPSHPTHLLTVHGVGYKFVP